MSGRRPTPLARWTLQLALGWALLLGQQVALLHPLAHLAGDLVDMQTDLHHGPHGAEGAAAGCDLCLACAAAAHLATALPVVAVLPQRHAAAQPAAAPFSAPGRAVATWRNRGPPWTA